MIAPLPPPVKKALHSVGRIAARPGIPDGRARIGWIDKEGNHVKDQISQRTLRIARENLWFAVGVKLLVLILAALGLGTLGMAVFADVGVTVLAVLNAMRALRQPGK